jgi:zinc finger-containing ubiquitin peptidase 1
MLCAHLLGRPQDARGAALFGGSGQLPDVGCLQAWLERAWSLGFDPDGARHFGGVIQGTSRWIGAGECAALLRLFGLHAKVITFKAAGSGGADAGQPVAQCDGCGVVPIRAVRYRSKSISDYDLCGACHASRADLVATCGPFVSIPIPAQAQAPQNDPVHGDACAPGSHQALLDWLWKYFTTPERGQNAAPWLLGCQVYTSSTRHPVFLQHNGHSVTVVGVERRPSRGGLGGRDVGREGGSEQFTLLVLDPAVHAAALSANLASLGQWPRLMKRGAHTLLKRREYQVVYVDPVPVPLHAALQTLAIVEETPPDSVFA